MVTIRTDPGARGEPPITPRPSRSWCAAGFPVEVPHPFPSPGPDTHTVIEYGALGLYGCVVSTEQGAGLQRGQRFPIWATGRTLFNG